MEEKLREAPTREPAKQLGLASELLAGTPKGSSHRVHSHSWRSLHCRRVSKCVP